MPRKGFWGRSSDGASGKVEALRTYVPYRPLWGRCLRRAFYGLPPANAYLAIIAHLSLPVTVYLWLFDAIGLHSHHSVHE